MPPSAPRPQIAGPRALRPSQRDAPRSDHANAADEQLLALSDERDLWLRRLHAAERDCEDRSRETFGQPHPADCSGDVAARARASREPYGLPPPGLVHLGGRVVHHHICTAACDVYVPGWYTPQVAAAILETLPGGYAEAIASLLASAGTSGRRAA